MSYDISYAKGGFKYTSSFVTSHLGMVNHIFPLKGKVLDAPCGDGTWSRGLRNMGCVVTSTDLSKVGAKKANGVCWNLEKHNKKWDGIFDLVFCRGISHIHHEKIAPSYQHVLSNFLLYAPRIVIIYYTSQTRRHTRPLKKESHFNHTKQHLDSFYALLPCTYRSVMKKSYYICELRRDG